MTVTNTFQPITPQFSKEFSVKLPLHEGIFKITVFLQQASSGFFVIYHITSSPMNILNGARIISTASSQMEKSYLDCDLQFLNLVKDVYGS